MNTTTADRRYLAAYYTQPPAARLLSELALAQLGAFDWSDARAIVDLRVVDFACGSGRLLAAAYAAVVDRHVQAGGDGAALHRPLLTDVLAGYDVDAAAIRQARQDLAALGPADGTAAAHVAALPYGRQPDGGVRVGALEWLVSGGVLIPDQELPPAGRSFDMVLLNPPFGRAANHTNVYRATSFPIFAAMGASAADQAAMIQRLRQVTSGTCYHGQAGLAAAFVALGDRHLRPGGVLAAILPVSAASGTSWQAFRRMIAQDYRQVVIGSIASTRGTALAFSDDTEMAEFLVVAVKARAAQPAGRLRYVTLGRRPIDDHDALRQARAAEQPGTPIEQRPEMTAPHGNGAAVTVLTAPVTAAGATWPAVRIADQRLAQVLAALAQGRLALAKRLVALPVTPLAQVATLGRSHHNIAGSRDRAFDRADWQDGCQYPALWGHHALRETRLICQPDIQLCVRAGRDALAAAIWDTASHLHVNLDFQYNSQPLAMAWTERVSIGGTAWPNVRTAATALGRALLLWGNSTLGLLLQWWQATRQHHGRGRTPLRDMAQLPVLDVRTLTGAQVAAAAEIFESLREVDFQPAYLADVDPARAELDRCVLCDLLGLDAAWYTAVRQLAALWCAEPTVHGGKERPA